MATQRPLRPNPLQRLLGLFQRRAAPPSPEAARTAMAGLQSRFDRAVTAYANGLAEGRVSLDTWQGLMTQEIKRLHLGSALAVNGGQPSAQVIQAAQQRANEQIGYLNAWADEMRTGKFPIDAAARIRQRARLYGGAANQTLHEALAAMRGIVLPQSPGDGRTRCKQWCKCTIDIEDGGDVWLVTWRLGIAEHCPDCKRLSETWNPRRIPKVRTGVV